MFLYFSLHPLFESDTTNEEIWQLFQWNLASWSLISLDKIEWFLREELPILIIASASADASADESADVSAAKYSEMSAILGGLGHLWPHTLLFD